MPPLSHSQHSDCACFAPLNRKSRAVKRSRDCPELGSKMRTGERVPPGKALPHDPDFIGLAGANTKRPAVLLLLALAPVDATRSEQTPNMVGNAGLPRREDCAAQPVLRCHPQDVRHLEPQISIALGCAASSTKGTFSTPTFLQCDLARQHDIRDWKDVPILRHEADVLPGVQVSDIARSDEIATTGRASDLEFFPFTMIMQLRGAQ